ncbi:hypothetical protein BGZ58_001050 [Dissophora ornata]|nr:hypothetical protein BGZ58_001050 [Dissophora ornata]
MSRRPVFHALFHSVASLGYIPFALTSAFISSSTPFVSISPIATILVAFVPPLTAFPLLCFSYRYLERFACVSLTVQRARTYIMLAGSGLCILVAAHLMMVHLLANGHNTTYNQLAHPSGFAAQQQYRQQQQQQQQQPIPITALESLATSSMTTKDGDIDGNIITQAMADNADAPTMDQSVQIIPLAVSESLMEALQETQSWSPSFLMPFFVTVPIQDQEQQKTESVEGEQLGQEPAVGGRDSVALKQKRDIAVDHRPLFKTLIPTHLLNPPNAPALEVENTDSSNNVQDVQQPQQGHDAALQQPFLVTEQPALVSSSGIPIMDTLITIPVVAGGAPPTSESTLDKPAWAGGENDNPDQPSDSPLSDLSSIDSSVATLPTSTGPVAATSNPHIEGNENTTSTSEDQESVREVLFRNTVGAQTPGYNLTGLHWALYLGAQGVLAFMLIVLFLGVLIMTEYVLDMEDEDYANLKYLYWARVVGIASATVVSAANGSLLSGYILLDGQSDWIAKAAVGTICVYWISITWIMNRVVGPLPY